MLLPELCIRIKHNHTTIQSSCYPSRLLVCGNTKATVIMVVIMIIQALETSNSIRIWRGESLNYSTERIESRWFVNDICNLRVEVVPLGSGKSVMRRREQLGYHWDTFSSGIAFNDAKDTAIPTFNFSFSFPHWQTCQSKIKKEASKQTKNKC